VLRTVEAFTGQGTEDPPSAEQLAANPHVEPLPDDAESYVADEAVVDA
jgi:hypothetical protein